MENPRPRAVNEQLELSEPPARTSPSNGGRDNFEGRLARLETHVGYLATKEDVSEVKVLIERKLNWVLYCMIGIMGIMVTGISGLVMALIRIW